MKLSRQVSADLFVREGCDWSTKAIRLALENKGVEIADLEKARGLKTGSMCNVFYRVVPAYEEIIAEKIGVEPSVIWPSRYSSSDRSVA